LQKLIWMLGYYQDVFDVHGSASKQMESVQLMKKAAEILAVRVSASDFHFKALISGKASDPQSEKSVSDTSKNV